MMNQKKKLLGALLLLVAGSMIPVSAQTQKPIEDLNHVTDLTLDSLNKVRSARIKPGTSRQGNHPVLFLIGNSTMRNGTLGNGNNGQWGWGYFAQKFFEWDRITVENQALGGTSSRTFYRNLWPEIREALKPGDWVIVSIGHNDNGPYDKGRARASIPGTGTDSMLVNVEVVNKGDTTYREEKIYTYGGYLRRYVADIRAKGANPVLMSLTPKKYRTADGSKLRGDEHKFGRWAEEIARELDVPFVDLNTISTQKLESYSVWKCNYHFYGDNIHTSKFGAELNARSVAEGIFACEHPAIAPLKKLLLPTEASWRLKKYLIVGKRPVVWLTGDSTVKNTDRDEDGMWGWGAVADEVFDSKKITVVNVAKAGRSLRTYLNEGHWDIVYNSLEKGDYVLIQFGHNDVGPIDSLKERGEIVGTADTCHVYRMKSNGQYEVVYSFGWYLRKMIDDTREKGATPILVSLTPRNIWKNGKIERRNDTYGKWYREIAEETGVELIDVHNITADKYDKKGEKKVKAYFCKDHTHSSLAGAKENAKSVRTGLRKMKSPLAAYTR
jgi:lysophospholipase L1-like esterase